MKKPKGIVGYPAADLNDGDEVQIDGFGYIVIDTLPGLIALKKVNCNTKDVKYIHDDITVRLIRKARGITYSAWQRKTSKILKAQGLSRWPGAAVMKPLFFMSYTPEDAAAAFLADNFLID